MDLFKNEQKITLNFVKNSNLVEMVCTIETIFDDRIEVNLPQYFMRYIEYLQVGKRITAKAFSKLGTIDFNSVIISSPLEDKFIIELDYNSIKLTPGVDLPVINAIEHLELLYDGTEYIYKTFEISTDYVKFNSDKKLKINETVNGTIKFPKDYGIIKFKGILTEVDEIYDTEYTILYSVMSEKDRQNLLYYMYMYTKDTD